MDLYDAMRDAYKDVGGSIWFKAESAAAYVNKVALNGERVQGAVYEVHLDFEGNGSLEKLITPSKGDWMALSKPARLGRKVLVGKVIDSDI